MPGRSVRLGLSLKEVYMNADTLERTTVNLSQPQLSWLRKEAGKLGITLGELLRRIIDSARGVK